MTKMNPSRKIKWQNFSLAEDMVADSDETASKVSNMIILSHKGTCIFTNLVRNFWDILEISTCHGRAAAKASMDFRLIAMPDKLNFSKSDSDRARNKGENIFNLLFIRQNNCRGMKNVLTIYFVFIIGPRGKPWSRGEMIYSFTRIHMQRKVYHYCGLRSILAHSIWASPLWQKLSKSDLDNSGFEIFFIPYKRKWSILLL